MDGNARWARRHALPVSAGHAQGVEALRRVVAACLEWGIPALTVRRPRQRPLARPPPPAPQPGAPQPGAPQPRPSQARGRQESTAGCPSAASPRRCMACRRTTCAGAARRSWARCSHWWRGHSGASWRACAAAACACASRASARCCPRRCARWRRGAPRPSPCMARGAARSDLAGDHRARRARGDWLSPGKALASDACACQGHEQSVSLHRLVAGRLQAWKLDSCAALRRRCAPCYDPQHLRAGRRAC